MGVGAGLYMYDVVVNSFTFAISSTDEFLHCTQTVRVLTSENYIFNSIRRIMQNTMLTMWYSILA